MNKQAWDEEREKRNQEREAWARQLREQSEARMKAREEWYESIRTMKEEKARYEKMVEEFYQELRAQNPEWEMRKREALKVCSVPIRYHVDWYLNPPCSVKNCYERKARPPNDGLRLSIFISNGWSYYSC